MYVLFDVSGDRFYAFLHHFSLYVLTKVMQRDHGKCTLFVHVECSDQFKFDAKSSLT